MGEWRKAPGQGFTAGTATGSPQLWSRREGDERKTEDSNVEREMGMESTAQSITVQWCPAEAPRCRHTSALP